MIPRASTARSGITSPASPIRLPIDKPLTVAAYESDLVFRAYVEPIAVGDPLPDMPLFLRPGHYVNIPLEATYQSTWRVFPQRWKDVIDPGR